MLLLRRRSPTRSCRAPIIAPQGPDSKLARGGRATTQGQALAALLYVAAIPLAFVNEWIADALYVVVALIWLVPDPRIEARLKE